MLKCGLIVSDLTVSSLIRRWDLDADNRISKFEFLEGITAQEAHTKKTTLDIKNQLAGKFFKKKRPLTVKAASNRPSLIFTN
jgi:hypothetical protein